MDTPTTSKNVQPDLPRKKDLKFFEMFFPADPQPSNENYISGLEEYHVVGVLYSDVNI